MTRVSVARALNAFPVNRRITLAEQSLVGLIFEASSASISLLRNRETT